MTFKGVILDRRKEIFYNRLSKEESQQVIEITSHLDQYLRSIGLSNYMIAGVGGIFRNRDPRETKDIDLAISGLNGSDLGKFNEEVFDYFSRLYSDFGLEQSQGLLDLKRDVELSHWKSKGLEIKLGEYRPIDIQFVFNMSPQAWIERQYILKEDPKKEENESIPKFPYTDLLFA